MTVQQESVDLDLDGALSPEPPLDRRPLVSVILPCLNEATGVGICIRKALGAIKEMGVEGEVLVVDNGSTDGSPEIAVAAGARVVQEERKGYGSAYLRGLKEAKGQYLVMGDADDTYDFSEIARFIEPLRENGYDFVMGTRLKGEILPGAMSWSHRWIGNPILSTMLKVFFKTRISDSHCGMRSFTREAVQRMNLHTTGMEFASEMVVAALRENLKIHEIPITYHPRVGDSKLEGLRDAWRHVRFMVLFSPSYLFRLPGFLLVAVGLLAMLAVAGGPRALGSRTWDYHVLLFGALGTILGYNLLLFDVLAKRFSMEAGFAKREQWLKDLSRIFTLERGLVLGGLLLLAGLGLEVKIVFDWARSGLPAMMAVRGFTIGLTAIVIGLQTVFASFFLSLLLIERR
ncbi:MAG: glycosyltransferase family 2 protein [Acidobacteriota bacterium]|nr:glycosyltransferase family 2 protein [Acidobacteriota bacterium]